GHRLDYGEPETLVERREGERCRCGVERRQVLGTDVAREHDAITQAELIDEREVCLVLPGSLADDHEPRIRAAVAERLHCVEQAAAVLARFEAADAEDVWRVDAVAARDAERR